MKWHLPSFLRSKPKKKPIFNQKLFDERRIVIRPLSPELRDPAIKTTQLRVYANTNSYTNSRPSTARTAPPGKLLYHPVSQDHEAIPKYKEIRDQIGDILEMTKQPFIFTLIEVEWVRGQQSLRAPTILIITWEPDLVFKALEAVDTEMRIEIIPGIVGDREPKLTLRRYTQPPKRHPRVYKEVVTPGYSIGADGCHKNGTLGGFVRERGKKYGDTYFVTVGHVALMHRRAREYPVVAKGGEEIQAPSREDFEMDLNYLQWERDEAVNESTRIAIEASKKAQYAVLARAQIALDRHKRIQRKVGEVVKATVNLMDRDDGSGKMRWKNFALVRASEERVGGNCLTPYVPDSDGIYDPVSCLGETTLTPGDALWQRTMGREAKERSFMAIVNGVEADMSIHGPLLMGKALFRSRELVVLGQGSGEPGDSGSLLFAHKQASAMIIGGGFCDEGPAYHKNLTVVTEIKTVLEWLEEETGKEFTLNIGEPLIGMGDDMMDKLGSKVEERTVKEAKKKVDTKVERTIEQTVVAVEACQ